MLEAMYPAILIGAGLITVGAFTSLIAFRIGAPLLLIFLGLGLIAGEDGLGIVFDDADAAYFIGSVALAVILFDSGFGTSLAAFRRVAAPAITLATVGVVLTAGLVGAAAYYIADFSLFEALLMGAIVSSTDAAAVFFLLRVGGITLKDRVRSTLEIESASNDPMAIFLTITLVEFLASGTGLTDVTSTFIIGFLRQMGVGLVLGLVGGFLVVQVVNRLTLESGLYPIIVLGASLMLFAAVSLLGGSGFLAVFVAGLYAGNQKMRAIASLRRFQDGMTWLAQIIMFLVLGLLATPSQFPAIALQAVAIAVFLTFIGRPLAIWLCLLPFRYQRNEEAFISWVGLRGSVSILLAIVPFVGGLENGQVFFNIAFIIVLTSLLVQGWTISPAARWLGLIIPPRIGPLEKFELELPGGAHHELIAYRVVPDSPVARGERIPRWARPSLVIREGRSMRYQLAGRLKAGDYVYLFIAPRYMRLLDRLFASPAKLAGDDAEFFGEFQIDPGKTLADLEKAYNVALPTHAPETTIESFMVERLGGRTEVGDRVPYGPIDLIVREVDESGAIKAVGISLDRGTTPGAQIPLFVNIHEILDALRARLGWERTPDRR
ncbi:potassium/proton antiporter [Rhodospirillaceae bacterium SYSU D60014]|uniref:potassium/proton antiporter n=1 Tax=Virgifigura deserti TaxID=2268457 RepID=UPI000E66C7F3